MVKYEAGHTKRFSYISGHDFGDVQKMAEPQWTFLTNHGRVLAYVARYPSATTREIARKIGVTERAIQKVILDLVTGGYVVRSREGRGNRYMVHPELPMRHAMEKERAVGDVLRALGVGVKS